MIYEFSKSDKKMVRQIIENGLQKEFEIGMAEIDEIIHKWKIEKTKAQDSYYDVYKTIRKFDKHIGRRYDGMTGSRYFMVLAGQFYDGIITENDLNDLSDEARQTIINYCEHLREL